MFHDEILTMIITLVFTCRLRHGHGMGWGLVIVVLLLGTFSFWSDLLNFQI